MTFILFLGFLALFVWVMKRRSFISREFRRDYTRNGVAKKLPSHKVARRWEDYL